MLFRTEVSIPENTTKINIDDHIFSIGSCFASELNSILSSGQLQTLNNPFGTIFHPVAINNAIQRICNQTFYTEEELIFHNNTYLSLDHHSSFDKSDIKECLYHINESIKYSGEFLKKTDWVIVTFGTSWVYEYLPEKYIVANCHKIDQNLFVKRLLSPDEILTSINKCIETIKEYSSKQVQIILTLSPVRHIKDGLVDNQRSKSLLLNAIHDIVDSSDNCVYLPIYEVLMDDLRGYRFYKEDLIHPNNQAIQYIWEKFSRAFMSKDALDFVQNNLKIGKSLSHRPFDKNTESYKEFIHNLEQKIRKQQEKVNFPIFKNFVFQDN